ncbi:hypothetical protein [Caldiplasma sukawensis]
MESVPFEIPIFNGMLTASLKQILLYLFNLFSRQKIYFSFPGFLEYIKLTKKELWSNMYLRYEVAFGFKHALKLENVDESSLIFPIWLEEKCIALGMNKGKSVIISPDSKSMPQIDKLFFVELYRRLEIEKFVPVINSNDSFWSNECFRTIFPKPVLLLNYIDFAGFSISARSGVSDLLSFVPRSINIIIYNKGVKSDFIIGEKKNELYGTIKEYFYDKEDRNVLIEEIINYIKN